MNLHNPKWGISGRMPLCFPHLYTICLLGVLCAASSGCITAVGLGVKLVGKTVDSADVEERQKVLVGAEPAAAEKMFGRRIDTLRDVNSDRYWALYPVDDGISVRDQYVVEVANDRIVALTRAEKNSDFKRDLPRILILEDTIKGKPPAECQAELEMGAPLLTVRSDATGLLSQVYDARHFKNLGSPDYCIIRFDKQERCKGIEFLGIGASTKKEPLKS